MDLSVADVLSACHFFSQVKDEPQRRLVAMARLRDYARGEMIFRQGEECPGVFVVGTGLTRVFMTAPSGKEHVLHMVGPGGTFAEVAAIGGFPCPAFAEALEATRCVLLPIAPFAQALREDHALCLQLMGSMAGWVKHLTGLVEDIVLRDAAGRTARYLLHAPLAADGSVRLPSLKRHLASHLNLTSETLSRTLRRLEEMRLLSSDAQNGIRLIDPDGLRAVAEGE